MTLFMLIAVVFVVSLTVWTIVFSAFRWKRNHVGLSYIQFLLSTTNLGWRPHHSKESDDGSYISSTFAFNVLIAAAHGLVFLIVWKLYF